MVPPNPIANRDKPRYPEFAHLNCATPSLSFQRIELARRQADADWSNRTPEEQASIKEDMQQYVLGLDGAEGERLQSPRCSVENGDQSAPLSPYTHHNITAGDDDNEDVYEDESDELSATFPSPGPPPPKGTPYPHRLLPVRERPRQSHAEHENQLRGLALPPQRSGASTVSSHVSLRPLTGSSSPPSIRMPQPRPIPHHAIYISYQESSTSLAIHRSTPQEEGPIPTAPASRETRRPITTSGANRIHNSESNSQPQPQPQPRPPFDNLEVDNCFLYEPEHVRQQLPGASHSAPPLYRVNGSSTPSPRAEILLPGSELVEDNPPESTKQAERKEYLCYRMAEGTQMLTPPPSRPTSLILHPTPVQSTTFSTWTSNFNDSLDNAAHYGFNSDTPLSVFRRRTDDGIALVEEARREEARRWEDKRTRRTPALFNAPSYPTLHSKPRSGDALVDADSDILDTLQEIPTNKVSGGVGIAGPSTQSQVYLNENAASHTLLEQPHKRSEFSIATSLLPTPGETVSAEASSDALVSEAEIGIGTTIQRISIKQVRTRSIRRTSGVRRLNGELNPRIGGNDSEDDISEAETPLLSLEGNISDDANGTTDSSPNSTVCLGWSVANTIPLRQRADTPTNDRLQNSRFYERLDLDGLAMYAKDPRRPEIERSHADDNTDGNEVDRGPQKDGQNSEREENNRGWMKRAKRCACDVISDIRNWCHRRKLRGLGTNFKS